MQRVDCGAGVDEMLRDGGVVQASSRVRGSAPLRPRRGNGHTSTAGYEPRSRRSIALLSVVGALVGCAADARGEQATTFVGALSDGSARIGVVIEGDAVVAYSCGAGETLRSSTGWVSGSMRGASVALRGTDAVELDAQLVDGVLQGELRTEGAAPVAWTAVRARAGTREGLYAAVTHGCRAGVIVWGERADSECEAQGSACDEQGNRSQVTVIDCPRGAPLQLAATLNGEELRFAAERVLPSVP